MRFSSIGILGWEEKLDGDGVRGVRGVQWGGGVKPGEEKTRGDQGTNKRRVIDQQQETSMSALREIHKESKKGYTRCVRFKVKTGALKERVDNWD